MTITVEHNLAQPREFAYSQVSNHYACLFVIFASLPDYLSHPAGLFGFKCYAVIYLARLKIMSPSTQLFHPPCLFFSG